MQWHTHAIEFLEAAKLDSSAIMEAAQVALMVEAHPVVRVVHSGLAIWCRVYTSRKYEGERLSALAIAPLGLGYDANSVSDAEFFNGRARPEGWQSIAAFRKGGIRADDPISVGCLLWRKTGKDSVALARCMQEAPLAVQLSFEGEAVPADPSHAWRALRDDPRAWKVWNAGKVEFYSFGHVMMIGRNMLRGEGKKNQVLQKPARSPAQVAQAAKWAAACKAGRERKKAAREAAKLAENSQS